MRGAPRCAGGLTAQPKGQPCDVLRGAGGCDCGVGDTRGDRWNGSAWGGWAAVVLQRGRVPGGLSPCVYLCRLPSSRHRRVGFFYYFSPPLPPPPLPQAAGKNWGNKCTFTLHSYCLSSGAAKSSRCNSKSFAPKLSANPSSQAGKTDLGKQTGSRWPCSGVSGSCCLLCILCASKKSNSRQPGWLDLKGADN